MKKLFLFLLALAFLAPAQAADWSKPAPNPELRSVGTWTFAPKLGLNLTNMTNSDGNLKPGLNLGVTAEYRFTDIFAVEPGLFYSMQGTKIPALHDSESGYTLKTKFKNDYLNIPVLAKFYVKDGWNVFFGPQLGFLVSSKLKGTAGDATVSVKTGDYYKKFDFSLVLGFGYQFEQGLLVSFNYNAGLCKTFKESWDITDNGDNSRNQVLQFNVGWRF